MNLVSIIILIALVILIGWAVYKTIKNKGKCKGCSGNCEACSHRMK